MTKTPTLAKVSGLIKTHFLPQFTLNVRWLRSTLLLKAADDIPRR